MDEVLVERQDHLLILRLNRPQKRNALTHAMYTSLAQHLIEAEQDDHVHVIIITGSLTCFTAGNDLHDFLQSPPSHLDAPAFRFMRAVMALHKPLIACVCGPAVGIGTTLLPHCDLVYISEDARLSLPFVTLGLTPEFGASLLLPQLLGPQLAAQLLLCGRGFSGAQAVQWGLASEAFAQPQACLARALEQAEQLARMPQAALRASKKLLRGSIALLDAVFITECQQFIDQVAQAETRAAIVRCLRPAAA